ncbi:hypothetical protein VTL71DRAFT_4225 [Oculimacula yallundae]|uniref:Uncharacterized protein n=1 Tax=Oculimacula yallundae TaxID=86028 RepID=A0ABR4C568_9HELO
MHTSELDVLPISSSANVHARLTPSLRSPPPPSIPTIGAILEKFRICTIGSCVMPEADQTRREKDSSIA